MPINKININVHDLIPYDVDVSLLKTSMNNYISHFIMYSLWLPVTRSMILQVI